MREATILLGGIDASKKFAENTLKSGLSVSVYPGGSREIFTTDPYSPATVLILKKRWGILTFLSGCFVQMYAIPVMIASVLPSTYPYYVPYKYYVDS